MIEIDEFWDAITEEVKEYLSLRYYSITRCLLTDVQRLEIAKNEIEYMSK